MAVIWWLARTEAAAQLRRGRFLFLASLCCLLAVVSVYLGAWDLRSLRRVADELAGGREAAPAAVSGRQAEPALRELRRPAPLSILVRGIESNVPLGWDFSPSGATPVQPSAVPDVHTWATPLDIEFVVRVILSLIALLTAADGLAGDRFSGSLRALRSQPISPIAAVLSKVLSGLLLMAVASGATILSAAGATALVGSSEPPGALALAMAGMLALAIVYSLIFYLIGLHVSMWTASPHTSAPLLLWVVLTLTLPPLMDLTPGGFTPARSATDVAQDYAASVRAIEQEMGEALVAAAGGRRDWNTLLGEAPIRAKLEDVWTTRIRQLRADTSRDASAQPDRRDPADSWWRFLSPANSLSAAMTRLAGTGLPLKRRWEDAAAHRQQELSQRLFDDRPRVNVRVPANVGGDLLSFDRHPPLRFSPSPLVGGEGTRQRLLSAVPPFLELVLMAFVLLVVLQRRFVRTE